MAGKLLSALEVAERLHVHVDTVYALVHRGELPSAKIGNQWRFDASQIEHWIAAQFQTQEGIHQSSTSPSCPTTGNRGRI